MKVYEFNLDDGSQWSTGTMLVAANDKKEAITAAKTDSYGEHWHFLKQRSDMTYTGKSKKAIILINAGHIE